jgi:hypothetical protein
MSMPAHQVGRAAEPLRMALEVSGQTGAVRAVFLFGTLRMDFPFYYPRQIIHIPSLSNARSALRFSHSLVLPLNHELSSGDTLSQRWRLHCRKDRATSLSARYSCPRRVPLSP